MLFECPSEPNGDFYFMAPEDSARTYLHIVRVLLLDAATATPIDVILRGEGITNLLKLRQYIGKPGLPAYGFTWTDPLRRGNRMHLNSEQCEDILAIDRPRRRLQITRQTLRDSSCGFMTATTPFTSGTASTSYSASHRTATDSLLCTPITQHPRDATRTPPQLPPSTLR